MKKKILALLTLAMSAVMLLTACGSSGAAPAASSGSGSGSGDGEPVDVEIWGLWANDHKRTVFLQEKADEYAAQHPGVNINIVYQNGYDGVAEKLTSGAVSGELPTLAMMEESFIQMFNPICLNIADYMDPAVLDSYNDGLMVMCNYDGKTLAVPNNRSIPVLYINTEMVKGCGVDIDSLKTWDDLYAACTKIHEATGNYGFGIYWDGDAWIWESSLYSNGGQVVSDDGSTITFGEDYVGAKTIELYQKMVNEGSAFAPFGMEGTVKDNLVSLFAEGKIAMFINTCGLYGDLNDACDFDITVKYQPEGVKESIVTGGSNWILLNTASDAQIKAAVGYLEYLADPEVQIEWYQLTGYLPVVDVSGSDTWNKLVGEDGNYQVILDELQYAHARPATKYWREMYTYLVDKLEQSVMDPANNDAHKLVDDAVVYCQKIIDDNQ